MRFGLALPHYDFSLPGKPTSFGAIAGWAQRAEELGFDSVWVSDHLFYSFARYGADQRPWGSLEPVTTLEGVVGLRTLAERFPHLRVSGSPVRRDLQTLRGFEHLPVRLR